jgi:dodecin
MLQLHYKYCDLPHVPGGLCLGSLNRSRWDAGLDQVPSACPSAGPARIWCGRRQQWRPKHRLRGIEFAIFALVLDRRRRPIPEGEAIMTVARVTKITASSTKGFQDAVQAALARATKTLHGITGLEVLSQKAKIEDGKIAEYRVTVELTFILD